MATSRSRGRMSLTTSPPISISPSLDVFEAGDRAQERALAAARRADQHGELAVRDVEVDAAHGVDRAEVLVQSRDLHLRHCDSPS